MRLLKVKIVLLFILGVTSSCSTLKEASFNQEYINKYKGEYKVEIPEAYELVNVMVALTKVGQVDSNMIDMTSNYHKDVMNYFSDFEEHKQIRKMNRKIKKPQKTMTYIHYLFYRWNALGYELGEDNKIYHGKEIPQKQFLWFRDPIREHKKSINDFIEKSDYRNFYSIHKNYYDSITNVYRNNVPINKMTNWLSGKFPGIAYDSYKIICSPLVNGTHYTQRYSSNGFSQTIMSVCPVYNNKKYNEQINEMNNSRLVFTEIDHNFINLISDKFEERIKEDFSNLDYWRKESDLTKAYDYPKGVFNEYMTWSLFSIYCIENYEKCDYDIVLNKMEDNMVNGRDFIKFKDFNRKLIELYENFPSVEIESIYEKMLDWSSEQQNNNTQQ